MLRQDVDGAVVSLPGTVSGNFGTCYVDECVSPGSYRYRVRDPVELRDPLLG